MDYGFSEQQELLRTAARAFLERECPTAHVRRMEEDEVGYAPALWRQLADLGWLGLPFPAEYGGGAAGFVDLAVLVEELGRALLPEPYRACVLLGGAAVERAGSATQKQAILPALICGERLLTLAHAEPGAAYRPTRIATRAFPDGDSWRLHGTKLFVPDAAAAHDLVTVARTDGEVDRADGLGLFLVPRDAPGVALTPLRTIGGDRQYEVVFADVRVDGSALLGPAGGAWPALAAVLRRATVLECVWMVGLAGRALELTVDFVKSRVQFGVPIGSFQAVQHRCADMATDLDSARFLAYEAAWKEETGQLAERDLAVAKAWVSDATRRIVASAQQLHGGAGFIREVDLQLYFRRAKASEYRFGDADYHRAALARALFDT